MKKINLIERLWTDSHEKQTPQRLKRYAGMLLMLLTLGVGQMWADEITFDGNSYIFFKMDYWNWWVRKHTTNGDGNFAYFYGSSGSKWSAHSVQVSGNYYAIKVPAGTWDHVILTRNNTTSSPSWDNRENQSNNIDLASGNNYISAFKVNDQDNTGKSNTWGTYKPTSTGSVSGTISITTAQTSTLTPSLTSNTTYNEIKSTAYNVTTNPGSAGSMSGNVFSATAAGTYTVTATITYNAKGFAGITETVSPTIDITVTSASKATLTYDGNDNTSGTAPDAADYAIDASATVAGKGDLAKSNYTFAGWNTAQYITGTDYSASSSITMDENKTLYAKWTRSVTLNQNSATSNGSTSVTATYNCATLPSITKPSKTGYTFEGWYTANDASGSQVINTSGALQSGVSGWTTSTRFTRTDAAATLYARWSQSVTLNANTGNHGSGDDGSATIVYKAIAKSAITHCTPATGYHLVGYYTAATDGTKILNADGSFADNDIEGYIDEDGKWVKAGATTLYAQYAANTYTVTLKPGMGGTGSDGTMTVDYDATEYKSFSHSITQTGYSISGWYNPDAEVKVLNANGSFAASSVTGYITSGKWTKASNCDLKAWWTPNPYAITFDATTNGGAISSGSSPQNVIFDATSVGSCPTAAQDGYCFDGWYTAASEGTKVINPDGSLVANVTVSAVQWTDGDGKWKKTSATTVYAVYVAPETLIDQPARIAGKRVAIDTLDAKNHPEIDSVIVHQLFSCTPAGNYNISYSLCYSNHVQLDVQPTIHYGTGAGVGYDTVWMPMEEIQMYELVAYLRTGSTRGAGDLVTTDTALVSVEKTWPVKVRYIMDGIDLRDPTEWPVYPSVRTTEVRIPAERNGYILDNLEYGVGITVDSSKTVSYGIAGDMYCTYIKTANASTITAHYKTKPNTVYFFQASGYWYTPYIFDYGTTGYWGTGDDNGKGAGADGHSGTAATRIDFMDDMYMMPIGAGTTKLAITDDIQKDDQGDFKYFYDRTYTSDIGEITHHPKVAYRTDYNPALSMFVPVATSDEDYYIENTTARYHRGFWVKYSPDRDSTGYYLKVYNQVAVDGAKLIQSIPMRLTQSGENDTWELTATMDLEGGKTYGFKYTKATGASTVNWYGCNSTMTSANHTDWDFSTGTNNCGLTTTSAGDYTFHLHCVNYGTKAANAASDSEVQGKMVMTVDYATLANDFRVVYQDDSQLDLTDGVGVEAIASQTIRARANGQDTVTFYIRKDATNRSMKFQKFNGSAWADVVSGTIPLTNTTGQPFTVSKDTTYQIYIQQNEDGTSVEATGMDYYSGSYYIRTDCVDEHKWDYKQSLDAHRMVESDYATHLTTDPFTHYYVSWVGANGNVKYVVATQYSPTLTDTLITDACANVAGGNLPAKGANVRFMYNKKTNTIKRAYLAGAQGGEWFANFLKLSESNDPTGYMQNTDGDAITSITFTDLGNFAYQASIKAKPGLTGKLTAEYNSQTQYFKGSAGSSETILGGTGESWQNIVMTYDFKANRLICAWTPGDTIDETMSINADVMIIRRGKNDAEQIVFKTNGTELQDVKYIYGVIQLDYSDLVGRMYSWDWWAYEHCMYYISFPFDVLVSDITGVGTIGQDWRIQRYNGALRAEKGWFEQDGVKTWWEDVHAGDTLHAYEGYSLLLARTRFNDSSNPIWKNKTYGDKVYLFFPSLNATTGIISNGEVTFTVPAHECTIDRPFLNPYGEYVSHKISDSHWNMLGMPLFENKTAFSIADGPTVSGEKLQYLYAWNSAGNTLGIQLTLDDEWEFKTMYSYMVQYTGEVTFKGSTINKIVAAKREEEKKNYYVKLELTKDEQFIGRTYVELRENAVDSFMLNEDICMVRNGVNADLFTYAGGYEAAANVLPIADQVIPVGIAVKKAGTYTFSMPSNFDGEVTLVDTYAQTRTNLAIDDYEIALPTGEITDRFYLEINVNKVPTAIDGTAGASLKDGKAHKFIEDQQMYILKNGVIYDARGQRVK